MTRTSDISISQIGAAAAAHHIVELGALLHACVHAGASIGFILPFEQAEAEAFWRDKVLPGVAAGTRLLLVATKSGKIVGTVQLGHDMPANQPHRADVSKLMVYPECRRMGLARALMAALECRARDLKRSLLTLDTRTGDAAEPLYASLGYRTAGVIPGYCLDPCKDQLDSTTVMYKRL